MTAPLQFPRFRAYRPEPDGVRLGFDFNEWCAELFRGDRLARRIHCASLDAARAEVARQEAAGLQRLPDARPDWTEVAYGSLSDGSLIDDGGDAA
ncbi:hypothetical protein [Methylobacterium sp. J-070]|uniref:hypothetical protein n=1 Tax=Methylobacterium sp. J-070 TaxID=2836650 RepID=UPI001FB90B0F|nr:hypothetical protein [Methylobacterium sp. J-070]MCJ2052612.1 hypothetical protein [Methylobacterium sp. J-070]